MVALSLEVCGVSHLTKLWYAAQMTIHLYAEHLLNIHTLSIQATLSTLSNKETKAALSRDGSTLILEHEGEEASITLPATITAKQDGARLTIPAVPSKDISFRLQIGGHPDPGLPSNSSSVDSDQVLPWSARSMTSSASLHCAKCHAVFLASETITRWTDLPSEGWAEMMDYWHCHKPDVPKSEDDPSADQIKKDLHWDGTLNIPTGVAMVNTTEFLLNRKDCQNVTVRSSNSFLFSNLP